MSSKRAGSVPASTSDDPVIAVSGRTRYRLLPVPRFHTGTPLALLALLTTGMIAGSGCPNLIWPTPMYLGIEMVDATVDQVSGVLISSVDTTSIFASQLKSNDIIISFYGDYASSVSGLRLLEAAVEPGSTVRIKLFRPGTRAALDAQGTAPLDDPAGIPTSIGLSIKDNGTDAGVVVASDPTSPAQESGILAGDLIQDFNTSPISDSKAFRAKVAGLSSGATITMLTRTTSAEELRREFKADSRVEHCLSYVGINVQSLTSSLATYYGYSGMKGAKVTAIYPNSAAAKAGLAVGDIIVQLAGTPTRSTSELKRVVLAHANETVSIDYVRSNRWRAVSIKLEGIISIQPPLPDLGLSLRDDASGVTVSSVSTGGAAAAADPPLETGDIILSMDSVPTPDVGTFNTLLATKTAGTSILIGFQRDGISLQTLITIPKTSSTSTTQPAA
ncbi:MAG TPA: PDZ domain-containing protein [Phycisphaerae bacterium]|nr:PDZ domain-containing protein [Phycisphaerae bacterium]HRY70454.1 PDZ domain-containing protein [Phycisphaerae bacterium]HSA27688.1 PDZ domain-containing protein [Phycisphaerae bacterium]